MIVELSDPIIKGERIRIRNQLITMAMSKIGEAIYDALSEKTIIRYEDVLPLKLTLMLVLPVSEFLGKKVK